MKKNCQAPTADPKIVLQPHSLDVLCGSGKVASRHPGNKRFRDIVAKHYINYAAGTSKTERMEVTQGVLHELFSSGCTRFLKKDPIFERYSVASRRVGRDKVSHSFRELKTASDRRNRIQNCCSYQEETLHRPISLFGLLVGSPGWLAARPTEESLSSSVFNGVSAGSPVPISITSSMLNPTAIENMVEKENEHGCQEEGPLYGAHASAEGAGLHEDHSSSPTASLRGAAGALFPPSSLDSRAIVAKSAASDGDVFDLLVQNFCY
jgi:hypothetical protein